MLWLYLIVSFFLFFFLWCPHEPLPLNPVSLQNPESLAFFLLWLTYRWPLQPLLYYFWPRWADTERKRAIAKGRKQLRGGTGQLCSWVHVSSSARSSGITELPREPSLTYSARLNSQKWLCVCTRLLSAIWALPCPVTGFLTHHASATSLRMSLLFPLLAASAVSTQNEHKLSAMRSVASA